MPPMPTTYNPQERTFIKRPELKICAACGQPIQPEVKPMNNHMSNYLNKKTGLVVTLNSDEPYFEVQGQVLHKIIGQDADGGYKTVPDKPIVKAESQSAPEGPKVNAPKLNITDTNKPTVPKLNL